MRKTLYELSKIFCEACLARCWDIVFEPRPNGLVLGSTGSVMTWIGLSINRFSHSEKTSCQEKTRLISPEVWAVATLKV